MTKKTKIKRIVGNYIQQYPKEYTQFLKQTKEKKETQTSWSKVKGSDTVERALFDIPETLYIILKTVLDEEEFNWLWSNNNKQGALWFYKEFPQFAISEK